VQTAFGADGEVVHLDLKNREVTAKSGRKYTYDYLLISTGCVPDVPRIPGLSNDFNSFYTSLSDARKLTTFVNTFEKGHIVILTAQMPIPCPGAPGKFTVLLDDYLRHVRGEEVRKNVEISMLWPVESIGPPAYNTILTSMFEERGITTQRKFTVSEIVADKQEVVSSGGERIQYDFLITVPPFKVIEALSESGLTDEKGWVPADKSTLQYEGPEGRHEEVYVVGDTGPAEILKTGIGAHYQALITAQNLINDLRGIGIKVPYRGETGCPFIGSSYTSSTQGRAHIALWTYGKPLEPFAPSPLGWFLYRAYYYIYWDTAMKALL